MINSIGAPIKLYINTPWTTYRNSNNILMFTKEIQLNADEPLYFISKCSVCGKIFHSRKSSDEHFCQKYIIIKNDYALTFLIKWISNKMITFNSIEDPIFKNFCMILNPDFQIPKPKELRKRVIEYSKVIHSESLSNIQSQYVSILIDGTSRFGHHFISIILYSRFEYVYYQTKIVTSENTANISELLNECIKELIEYDKIVCAVCSDNFSANRSACEFDNLKFPIFRQYCNCHCANLAISNLFGIGKEYYNITQHIKLSLRLLKNSPRFSSI